MRRSALFFIPLIAIGMLFMVPACEDPVDVTDNFATPDRTVAERKGVPSSATIIFGDPNAGSPFPPEEGHDASHHASDKMVPRTVVIAEGGEVTFEVAPFHQVAIYDVGTEPEDIDITMTEDLTNPFFIPDFIINDPNNRVALSPDLNVFPTVWTTPAGTFDEPGKYLVTCTTFPHFVEADMYGWVIVK